MRTNKKDTVCVFDSHETYSHPLVKSECIASDVSVLICSPYHKLSRKDEVLLQDIVNEEFIIYAKNTNYWEQISDAFNEYAFKPNLTMDLYDLFAVKKMVSLGMGISIVPKISVKQEIEEGTFVELKLKELPVIKRYSLLIYRKDHIFSEPSKNFYDVILDNKFLVD